MVEVVFALPDWARGLIALCSLGVAGATGALLRKLWRLEAWHLPNVPSPPPGVRRIPMAAKRAVLSSLIAATLLLVLSLWRGHVTEELNALSGAPVVFLLVTMALSVSALWQTYVKRSARDRKVFKVFKVLRQARR